MTNSSMTDADKDAFLKDLYYVKHRMQGRDAIFNHVKTVNKNISRRYIMGWLMKQKVHQMYSNRQVTTNIRPSISNRAGALL
jgi:hypothetical protein